MSFPLVHIKVRLAHLGETQEAATVIDYDGFHSFYIACAEALQIQAKDVREGIGWTLAKRLCLMCLPVWGVRGS